ncbi:MAG TPA: hypothetical protein VMW23_07755 [Sedimentisphaerales bacterium]|nr:hypothetical protein [Sedimentisphaerales bacterium]
MRGYVLISVLMAVLLPATLFAQESEQPRQQPVKKVNQQKRLGRQRMESGKRESEMKLGRKMKSLGREHRRLGLENKRRFYEHPGKYLGDHRCPAMMRLVVIGIFVVHVLLAVWVYQDIRQRRRGSGIWIVVVLLAGLLGVLPYAVVRLGDVCRVKSEAQQPPNKD